MARKNPVPEQERQICCRLLFFRKEIKHLTRREMARALGIAAVRLQTYESGRVPLTTEVALKLQSVYDADLPWFAEGKDLYDRPVKIAPETLAKMAECRQFSDAYWKHLKPALGVPKNSFERLLERASPRFAEGGITVETLFGTYGAGSVSGDAVASKLAKDLKAKLDALPPEQRVHFRNHILSAAESFDSGAKTDLTSKSENRNFEGVKSEMKRLLGSVRRLVAPKGAKAKLAAHLKVPPSRVSEWLAGKYEPSGEIALRLYHWVEQQECQK